MSENNCQENFDKEHEIDINWEKNYIIMEKSRDEMESMWEVIFFVLFNYRERKKRMKLKN